MTAFDDILTAEREAEKSIQTAKEEVAEAISVARADRKTKVDAETAKLDEVEKEALKSHESDISKMTQKIQKEVDEQVSEIEAKFATHESDLKAKLKKKFA